MERFIKELVAIMLMAITCCVCTADKGPNSMNYHEVQGPEVRLGYFVGERVDTYYLILLNSPSQFAYPKRLVLGVNKDRAIDALTKLYELMKTGEDFRYVDKSGVEYIFIKDKLTPNYIIKWNGSDNEFAPIRLNKNSIKSTIDWLNK